MTWHIICCFSLEYHCFTARIVLLGFSVSPQPSTYDRIWTSVCQSRFTIQRLLYDPGFLLCALEFGIWELLFGSFFSLAWFEWRGEENELRRTIEKICWNILSLWLRGRRKRERRKWVLISSLARFESWETIRSINLSRQEHKYLHRRLVRISLCQYR